MRTIHLSPKLCGFWTTIALMNTMFPVRPVFSVEPLPVEVSAEAAPTPDNPTSRAQAAVKLYGDQWAQLIAGGKENTTEARRVRQKYEAAVRTLGGDLQRHRLELLWPQREKLIKELAHEIIIGRRDGKTAQHLNRRIQWLTKLMNYDLAIDISRVFESEMKRLAKEWYNEKLRDQPRPARLKLLQQQIHRLGPGSLHQPQALLLDHVRYLFESQVCESAWALSGVIDSGQEYEKRLREARQQVISMGKKLGFDGAKQFDSSLENGLSYLLGEHAKKAIALGHAYQPELSEEEIKEKKKAEQGVARLSRTMKISPQPALYKAETEWLYSAPWSVPGSLVAEEA